MLAIFLGYHRTAAACIGIVKLWQCSSTVRCHEVSAELTGQVSMLTDKVDCDE